MEAVVLQTTCLKASLTPLTNKMTVFASEAKQSYWSVKSTAEFAALLALLAMTVVVGLS